MKRTAVALVLLLTACGLHAPAPPAVAIYCVLAACTATQPAPASAPQPKEATP